MVSIMSLFHLEPYEKERLNNEVKWNIFEKKCFTEHDYPFTNKPDFSILGSIIEIFRQENINKFYS